MIVIVTTGRRSPAYAALRAEGYWPELVRISKNNIYGYGKTLADCWTSGQEFINVEHDIAPWEGAIKQLEECTGELCLFGYPRAQSGSLGLIRFSQSLIDRFPEASARWSTTPWNMLEQAVLGYFKNVEKHQHYPNVAHLSGWFK